jgi:hypothetical protein
MSNQEKKPGKSLWSSIASLVVETDEKPATAPEKQPVQAAMAAPTVPGQLPTFVAPVNSLAPDPDMIAQLQTVVTKKASPYSAFLESAATLDGIIPDETMRLRAAIKVVTGDGKRTFEQISSAIDMHISDVEGQRLLFKGAADSRRRSEVDAPKQRAESLRNQNVQIQSQVEQLEAQIARLRDQAVQQDAEASQLDAQAQAAEADISTNEHRFGLSVDYVKNELAAKKQLISTVGNPIK